MMGTGHNPDGDEMQALCSHLNITSTSKNNSVFNAATTNAAAGNMMHAQPDQFNSGSIFGGAMNKGNKNIDNVTKLPSIFRDASLGAVFGQTPNK